MRRALLIPILFAAALPETAAEVQTFAIHDPEGRNVVTFESKAPLERIYGTSHAVRGSLRVDRDDLTWCAGQITVPLESLDTGIPLRNTQMCEQYLETDRFPSVVFQPVRIISAEPPVLEPGQASHLVLEGLVSLHGVERRERVEVEALYFPEDDRTRLKMSGNLLRIDATFDVKLSDYDIPIPKLVVLQLDDQVHIRVGVTATDRAPKSKKATD